MPVKNTGTNKKENAVPYHTDMTFSFFIRFGFLLDVNTVRIYDFRLALVQVYDTVGTDLL